MKVICAGMNKTGTKSISEALRQLGFTVYDWEEQLFDFLDYWVDVYSTRMQMQWWIYPVTFSGRKYWKHFLTVK